MYVTSMAVYIQYTPCLEHPNLLLGLLTLWQYLSFSSELLWREVYVPTKINMTGHKIIYTCISIIHYSLYFVLPHQHQHPVVCGPQWGSLHHWRHGELCHHPETHTHPHWCQSLTIISLLLDLALFTILLVYYVQQNSKVQIKYWFVHNTFTMYMYVHINFVSNNCSYWLV